MHSHRTLCHQIFICLQEWETGKLEEKHLNTNTWRDEYEGILQGMSEEEQGEEASTALEQLRKYWWGEIKSVNDFTSGVPLF